MKKRRVKKSAPKKAASKKSRKYSLKQYLPHMILASILLIVLLLSIQNPISGYTITGNQVSNDNIILDPIVQFWQGWLSGQGISENLAKILFLVLVIALIWSILDTANLFSKGKFLIAVIVGFLSTMYIAPQDIWVILTSYQALGATLITLIPFTILALYTYRAAEDGKPRLITLQRVIWFMFTIFLLYFYISGVVSGKINIASGYGAIYLLATLVSAVCFFMNPFIVHQIVVMHTQAAKEAAVKNLSTIETGLKGLHTVGSDIENPGTPTAT